MLCTGKTNYKLNNNTRLSYMNTALSTVESITIRPMLGTLAQADLPDAHRAPQFLH